ncbi:MAG: hypothetical protein WD342_17530 [Verrucomicrobiales bacterium]
MKLATHSGSGIVWLVLFWLLFLAGGAPRLEASPPRFGTGGRVNLVDNPFDGLRHLRRGHTELVHAGWYVHDPASVCDLLIHRFRVFYVHLPLLYSEFAGDVVDNSSLLGSPVGTISQHSGESNDDGANTGTNSSDQRNQDGGVETLEVHEMVLAVVVGFMIGAFIVALSRGFR